MAHVLDEGDHDMPDGHHDQCERNDVHRGECGQIGARDRATPAEPAALAFWLIRLGDRDQEGGDDVHDEAGPDEVGQMLTPVRDDGSGSMSRS